MRRKTTRQRNPFVDRRIESTGRSSRCEACSSAHTAIDGASGASASLAHRGRLRPACVRWLSYTAQNHQQKQACDVHTQSSTVTDRSPRSRR